jgi:hypothetical protein
MIVTTGAMFDLSQASRPINKIPVKVDLPGIAPWRTGEVEGEESRWAGVGDD